MGELGEGGGLLLRLEGGGRPAGTAVDDARDGDSNRHEDEQGNRVLRIGDGEGVHRRREEPVDEQ